MSEARWLVAASPDGLYAHFLRVEAVPAPEGSFRARLGCRWHLMRTLKTAEHEPTSRAIAAVKLLEIPEDEACRVCRGVAVRWAKGE